MTCIFKFDLLTSKDWFRYVNNWNSIQGLGDGKSITVWIGYSIDVDNNVCCSILIWYWLPVVGLKEIMLTWTAKRILASYTYCIHRYGVHDKCYTSCTTVNCRVVIHVTRRQFGVNTIWVNQCYYYTLLIINHFMHIVIIAHSYSEVWLTIRLAIYSYKRN